MQNDYVKALATKTFQEEIPHQPYRRQVRVIHTPSFLFGFTLSALLIGFY